MRVLVTGISGFVGSYLAEYIFDNHPDVEVFGFKRWRSPMENIKHIEHKLNLIDGDLRDLTSVFTLIKEIKPDLIFHLASQSYVPVSYSTPNDTITTNVIGTVNLLEAVRLSGLDPMIHLCSSPEVYGEPNKEDIPITESCPFRPVSPYAVSKVSEDMLGYMYYKAYNLKIVRSRAFTHTGPRQSSVFVTSSFAKQIASIFKKGTQEPVIKVGNLDSIRTFCDVRDTVKAYWLLLQYGEPGEVYNICGNETMTIREMLDKLLFVSGMRTIKPKIEVDASLLRPKDVTLQIANDTKFRKITGWEPEINFGQTLWDIFNYWNYELAEELVNV